MGEQKENWSNVFKNFQCRTKFIHHYLEKHQLIGTMTSIIRTDLELLIELYEVGGVHRHIADMFHT